MHPSIQIFITNLSLIERMESEPAVADAVQELKNRSIPIILCTARTFEETVAVRAKHGLIDPFIVENGGAIYFQKGYFAATDVLCERKGEYQRISLGLPYHQIVLFLSLIKKLVPGEIIGFSDMTDAELEVDSGMTHTESRVARRREYDEPFKIIGNTREILGRIERTLRGSGLVLSKGGRYYHLTGNCDQGRAIALLRRLYQECYGPVSLMAVGSSPSEATILENVDHPVIVANPDGRHFPRFVDRLPETVKAVARKAKGLEEAMAGLLQDWEKVHAQ